MYEAQSECPEGWGGGLRKIPFRGGGMDIFWNYTLQIHDFLSEVFSKIIIIFCPPVKLIKYSP